MTSEQKKSAEIFVTRPFLPPLEEFVPLLQEIWRLQILTNNGPFHKRLEHDLERFLNVSNISLYSNGTLALVAAIRALNLTGEVITTPYSFVATAHAVRLAGLTPKFVDIAKDSLGIDPYIVERSITENTSAILATHVYGVPADVEKLEYIAQKYRLRLLFDAAHAFGVECHCKSLLGHGDCSVLSFHATKVFSTFEGGAVISNSDEIKRYLDNYKNFGFESEISVSQVGTNSKLNEVSAAFGLLSLKYYNSQLATRKAIYETYRNELTKVAGLRLQTLEQITRHNYSYFPIFVEDGFPTSRDFLYEKLREKDVYARRYFYPLITEFSPYKSGEIHPAVAYPVAYDISSRVLCLPIYASLSEDDLWRVIAAIKEIGRGGNT